MYVFIGIPEKWDSRPEAQDLGPICGTFTWDPGAYMWDTWVQSKKSHFVYLPQIGFI